MNYCLSRHSFDGLNSQRSTESVPEKNDSGFDDEIINLIRFDDLAKLYLPRHHYECGGAKKLLIS